MSNHLLPARRAIMGKLKADTAVTALVPAASIYPAQPPAMPAFPFIRMGPPTSVPRQAACLDGSDIAGAIHVFSTGRKQGSALVETAEDHVSRICSAVEASVHLWSADIDGKRLKVAWASTQLLQDQDEASAFHGVVSWRGRVR